MRPKRIAVACQGGGSQCAFIAGALQTLLSRRGHEGYRVVGLSGTSGGALTAALAWYGLLREARGKSIPAIEDRILAFWRDLSAQTPQEIILDGMCVEAVRLTEAGLLPSIATSPSSTQFQLWSRMMALLIGRPEFTDLRALLLKHIDFGALPALVEPDSPVLLVGAGDVMEGTFKIFSSANQEIGVDALLASAAIPNLFPAVRVDGHAYWDGIFASNPPVLGFLRRSMMAAAPVPDEIWIIQVNRPRHPFVPERPGDIFDRRNHLAGNLSLQHELQTIEMVNFLLAERALTDGFRARFGLDTTEAITVRFIRMSEPLQRDLDYPSKLSRQPSHIARLIADGRSQAESFLAALQGGIHPTEASRGEAPAELH
jgi:NTE family protein